MAIPESDNNRVVLDTSLFVNPAVRGGFGDSPTEAFAGFLSLASRLPGIRFYMPTTIFEELQNFVNAENITGELLMHLHIKSPKRHELMLPAVVLYDLVEELRGRVNKGLRIAEQAVRSGAPENQAVQELRRKYREALREGIVDSKEDVDLILLARELDALLVSADQGVVKWADNLGVRCLLPEKFRDYLDAELKRAGPAGLR